MSPARPSSGESQPDSLSRKWSFTINGSRPLYVAAVVTVATIYFAAAKFGLSLASVHTNVSPVWPPAGIALAALLLLGIRVWPGIFIGAFLANLMTPVSAATVFGIAFGNTLEAIAAAGALKLFGFRKSLDRARDVFKFVAAAAICTMIAATIGTLSLCLGHAAAWSVFGSLWMTWWLGDLTGAVTLAPLILTWATSGEHWLPKRRYLEATLLIVLLSVSSIVTFGESAPISVHYYPLSRLMVPFLLWAAFRLGRRGVTVAIAVVSAFAIWGTAHGFGPFISDTPNESLLMLQFFIATNAVTFLFLVTVVEEKRNSEKKRREDQRRLKANLAVTRILAESPEANVALHRILATVGETLGWEFGSAWVPAPDGKVLRNAATWQPDQRAPRFEALCRERVFEPGIGLPGRIWTTLTPAWIPDVTKDDNFPRGPIAAAEGLHGAFGFPIMFKDKLVGVMEFFSPEIRQPDEPLLAMFAGIGSQIGQFIERKQTEAAVESASLLPKENPAPVIRITREGMVAFANPAAGTVLRAWKVGVGKTAPDDIAGRVREVFANATREAIELSVGDRIYSIELAPIISGDYVNLYFNDITDRKSIERSLAEIARQQSALFSFADTVQHAASLDEIYNAGLDAILGALQCDRASILIHDDLQVLRFVGWRGLSDLYRKAVEGHSPWRPDDPNPRPVTITDVETAALDEELKERIVGEGIHAAAFIPLVANGRLIGKFMAYYSQPHEFSAAEINLGLTLARQLATGIDSRRAAEALRHMAAIVETTDDAVISKDLNGIITSWNPAAEKLYGYKAEEVIGQPVNILIPVERPDEEPAILARLRRGERIDHYETIRVAKDGQRLHVSLTVSPIRDATGKIIGASKIARDITLQKQHLDEIARLLAAERAARRDAEVASRTKDVFLATLSHELRTPLTAMLGWLTILRKHKLDKKTNAHAIETIERNAKAQAQLIEDLVDISRIVGGKLNLEVVPTELLPVINAAVEVVRPAANAKQISIEVNYDATVGPVSGDEVRLQQVIWNLLSNAVKFTPKGGSVFVDFRRSGAFAEVVVRDTGIGISSDFLPHVFERFRQGESSATRSHRGMGLGLAIVRHLVELHGGTVSAASDGENRGASLSIHLPLATVSKAAAAKHSKTTKRVNRHELKGLRVLLVEDEPDARELIAMLLTGSGADVEAVESASGALQRLSLFIPDVLVSDIGLPRESGYDLIRKVRALASEVNKVPAIALTAFATENDRQQSLLAGFQAHLAKPVEPADLLQTIKFVINGKH